MKFYLLVGIFILVSGCASSTNYGKKSLLLDLGMSKAAVVSILGEPKRTDVNSEREKWVYWNPQIYGFTPVDSEILSEDKLILTFVDGNLSKWGRGADLGDIVESSHDMQKALLDYYKPPDK